MGGGGGAARRNSVKSGGNLGEGGRIIAVKSERGKSYHLEECKR